MIGATFTIVAEPHRRLLRMTLEGHWDVATVERFRLESGAAIDRMCGQACSPGEQLVLIDRRSQGPQAQEVVEALRAVAAANTAKARRIAILVSGALLKRQTDRNRVGDSRVFGSEPEAMAWLLGE